MPRIRSRPPKSLKPQAKKYFCYSLEMDRDTALKLRNLLRGQYNWGGTQSWIVKLVEALNKIPRQVEEVYPHASQLRRRTSRAQR